MDRSLSQALLNERWVYFSEVKFRVAPLECWPELRKNLLEVEHGLAARQHDVGFTRGHPFDPVVPKHVWVLPRPYPYDPEKRAWLWKDMEEMCRNDVLERSDAVVCTEGVVLVEEQKEGTRFRFYTDFREINAVSFLVKGLFTSRYPFIDRLVSWM